MNMTFRIALCVLLCFTAACPLSTPAPKACDCLATLQSDSFSSDDVQSLEDSARACFDENDSQQLAVEASCLPFSLGVDSRNGIDLEMVYFCSDVCPDAGFVFLGYRDVEESDCASVGGEPLINPAFRSYVGCVPQETTD